MENVNNDKVLDVKNLRISFRTNGGTVKAVRGINFSLYRGRTLAIVGESGSGKSVTSKAILGILANNKIVEGGQIIYDGQDLLKIDEEHFHKIRGVKISMIFQDPLSSLNPIMIVGKQLTEAMVLKHKADIKEAKKDLKKADLALAKVDAAKVKALKSALTEAKGLQKDLTGAKTAVSKSANAVDSLKSRLEKLDATKAKEGKESDLEAAKKALKERLSAEEALLATNKEAQEKALEAIDSFAKAKEEEYASFFQDAAKLSLKERLEAIQVVAPEIEAAKNADFEDEKSFSELVRHLLSLKKELKACTLSISNEADNDVEVFPSVIKYIETSIKEAAKNAKKRDAALEKTGAADFWELPPAERAKLPEIIPTRADYIKEFKAALDTLLAHLKALEEEGLSQVDAIASKANKEYWQNVEKSMIILTKREADEKAIAMLKEVGIHDAERRFKQYPFELSGGMRQRIVIAIALCSSPEVLICDEPTTALDVTIQSQILELINKLKKERNLSIVFITHDLGVVANMADDIAVMYAGKIIEYGTSTDIFYDPRHPYTIALLGSMPDLETKEKLHAIPGTPPNMLLPPKGDAFADRNEHALAIDYIEQPPFFEVSPTHSAATWALDEMAPDFEVTEVVKSRIRRALTAHPEFTPKPTNRKNSVLNNLKKEAK